MLRHPDYTRERLKQLAGKLRKRVYSDVRPFDSLVVSGPHGRIPESDAAALPADVFKPVALGDQYGPDWATFWFRGRATVPPEWAGGRVDLLWETHSESTLWIGHQSRQGLNYDPTSYEDSSRPDAVLARDAAAGQELAFEIEVACNRKFGVFVQVNRTRKNISPYVLDRAEIGLFDPEAWDIAFDFGVLQALEAETIRPGAPQLDKSWAGELLSELNRFANAFDLTDRATWAPAHREILKPLLTRRNATTTHELSAIGHAHIDTAWLWPLAETRRKCVRTFSTACSYMDEYPQYRFSCSQAWQYEAVREDNPDLFARIKERAARGQWIPVGGMWIEPDCNIPSGESLIRQFLVGQRYFEREFGAPCGEMWIPDVFGYNGQLPQICRMAGIGRFLTQKLSWNRFNKPWHHTFTWEGVDGSEIFTHFPPADTYNADATVHQLRDNAANYKDHDRSRHSLMLFGWGDGGGGPTREMLERLTRAAGDIEGLPRVTFTDSASFFDRLEADCADRPRLVGELYLEAHRGTFTTQAAVKQGNRMGELMLHDVEFLSAVAARLDRPGFAYPTAELDRLWKLLLLNQFHDILPGSSITEVYVDAAADHAEVFSAGARLRAAALVALAPPPGAVVNTLGFGREEILSAADGTPFRAAAPAYGFGGASAPAADAVTIAESADGSSVTLSNRHLKAVIDRGGSVESLRCAMPDGSWREALAGPANELRLYRDEPTNWDAWDMDPQHLEMETICPPPHTMTIVERHPLRVTIEFKRKIGVSSSAVQRISLGAIDRHLSFHTSVEWHETDKMLKAAFPTDIRAMNATYEMQFHTVERPTHVNTSFDLAKYEVPGHRFADLGEHGFGVSVLSAGKYGWSARGNTLFLTLLRSPKHPDPQADMGHHEFRHALMPRAGGWREAGIVAAAAAFNHPLVAVEGGAAVDPAVAPSDGWFRVVCSNPGDVVLDTVKKAEDSDALVLRLYETHGARGTAQVTVNLPFTRAWFADGLERETAPAEIGADGRIAVPYTPHRIVTLMVE